MNIKDILVYLNVIGLVISGCQFTLMMSNVKDRLDELTEKIADDIDMYTLIYALYSAVDCTMTISVALILIAITMLVIYAG